MSVCPDSSPVTRPEILCVTQITWSTATSALCTKEGKACLTEALASLSAEPRSLSVGTMVRHTAVCVLPTQIVWPWITTGPARLSASSRNTVLWLSVLLSSVLPSQP